VALIHGPEEDLASLQADDISALQDYQPYYATRADLLAREGHHQDAVTS
jgi:predicted RNA polymerase sigma factor